MWHVHVAIGQLFLSSTSTFNAQVKKEIIGEICCVPDCSYTEEELKV